MKQEEKSHNELTDQSLEEFLRYLGVGIEMKLEEDTPRASSIGNHNDVIDQVNKTREVKTVPCQDFLYEQEILAAEAAEAEEKWQYSDDSDCDIDDNFCEANSYFDYDDYAERLAEQQDDAAYAETIAAPPTDEELAEDKAYCEHLLAEEDARAEDERRRLGYCDFHEAYECDCHIPDSYYEWFENDPAESIGLAWQEVHTMKRHADMAQARAVIAQVEASIMSITTEIAEAECEMLERDYSGDDALFPNAEVKLMDAETRLTEMEVVLANARAIGSAVEAVAIAENDVKSAEAIIWKKYRDVHTMNLQAKRNAPQAKRNAPVEYVNALIELAEAKDALDLAEILLAKTPSLSLTHGYGFASYEPHCPTSYIPE